VSRRDTTWPLSLYMSRSSFNVRRTGPPEVCTVSQAALPAYAFDSRSCCNAGVNDLVLAPFQLAALVASVAGEALAFLRARHFPSRPPQNANA
jgi:hypothetical protein